LLVEDDWRVRIGIRYYLQQLGFEVIEAGNVGEALSHANGTVGLLVTDVILPEVTGPGIRQLLRQAQPELKALYISAHPARYLIDQGLVGADDVVLQKPFDLQEFAYRLEEVCCSAPPAAAAPAPVHAPVG
jgi:DNA-binding response OmpR family regulator